MEYLNRMKAVQTLILEFLDNEEEDKAKFDELTKLLNFQQTQPDTQELKSILHLTSKIAENHYRNPLFFDKIKKIITYLKKEIKQTFSNIEIYNFYKKNKLILLFLIDEGIIIFDNNILEKIGENKNFFYPEINKLNHNDNPIEIPEDYEEKRRKGENDSYLCEVIRNDNIEEFIIYCTKKGISLSSTIKSSIYETNSFLEGRNQTLIEYSAFFGSIQILRFLFQNQVELTQSLWLYAIHGNNPEIIHFLEENQIFPKDKSYQECLEESIKCHNNDFALYFRNNFINLQKSFSDFNHNEFKFGFHYYNFQFIPIELDQPFCFFYAIEYNDFKLVEYYKNIEGLDINLSIILKINIFFNEIAHTKNFNDILIYNFQ